MSKHRVWAVIILILAVVIGYFVYSSEKNNTRFAMKYGLDLTGGTHLVYKADTSSVDSSDVDDAMDSLKNVIERRVNLFGVSEPIVQKEKGFLDNENRLVVELPGVTDVEEAVRKIGETPVLEFRLVKDTQVEGKEGEDPQIKRELVPTGLTGRYLEKAQISFEGGGNGGIAEPAVLLYFNKEGEELFAKITKDNIGKSLAILLDGEVISDPVIRQEITGGSAVISGSFTPDEARFLARDLNFGALPLPISLISTQSIGPTLGKEALSSGIKAGIVGLILVALFMLVVYRLPGLISVISLIIYLAIMISIFKLMPIVLTGAGIAGFIISIGMAVDANVLIFERLKEEKAGGKKGEEAVTNAFKRAWLAIRDGNLTSILTAIVLFYAGTFLTQSFAITFGLGVVVSMFSAVTITRTLLLAIAKSAPKPKA